MTSPLLIEDLVRSALLEDLGHGHDITTQSVIPGNQDIAAKLSTRQSGVLSGLVTSLSAFMLTDPDLDITVHFEDGDSINQGDIIADIEGPARAILTAERTTLNFLTHLSGIATLTAQYVDAVKGTKAKICDTRKTIPGLRPLQKNAVRHGGGQNHRFGLDDAILIKDNHIAIAGGVNEALTRAREKAGHLVKIEIEVDTLEQLKEVINHGGADVVMLDNFEINNLKKAVETCYNEGVVTEASGGVTLDTIQDIAKTGVDYISIGALTHSAPALDIGLDIGD